MNIALIGDVGGFPKGYSDIKRPKYFYHVGDEAMMQSTIKWYEEFRPEIKLTVLSWGRKFKNVKTTPHFVWPTKRFFSRLYLPFLLSKLVLYKFADLNTFSNEEMAFVKTLEAQDVIHFAGGGNITSLYPAWLSYCFFIILGSWLLGKKTILTSQTIGPFKFYDSIWTPFVLNTATLIGLRQNIQTNNPLLKYGIFLPKIIGMTDAAYTFQSKTKKSLKNILKIGYSLHTWDSFTEDEAAIFLDRLQRTLAIGHNVSFIELPHITKGETVNIQKLTSEVDLVLTTRYHGLIFALSANVPAISLIFDSYYQMKMNGALHMVYGEKIENYRIYLKHDYSYDNTFAKIKRLITNLPKEKKYLKKRNDELSKSKVVFSFEKAMEYSLSMIKINKLFAFKPV